MHAVIVLLQSIASACTKIEDGDEIVYVDGYPVVSVILQLLLLYYNHFMALWMLFGFTRVSRYRKKHSPTHTSRDHQSSFICFLHLHLVVEMKLDEMR